MVTRGWDFETLMDMRSQDFYYWLKTAVEAAKEEQAAMKSGS
ncbi:hypothetical protein [Bartonella sp. HY761]|nr:hypothetical protein [Bartonella sp. HY761]UXN07511.1 hypothetical protein N6A79_05875 [Bartonella sp. HY761]